METCRLCLSTHKQPLINVFSSYKDNNVANIISKHIGEVNESDPLPKLVCLDCWRQIDNFHEFHEKVHAAQDSYLKELIKREQENNFVGIVEPIHVSVDTTTVPDDLHDELINEVPIKIEYDACKTTSHSPPLIACDVLVDEIGDESNQFPLYDNEDDDDDAFEEGTEPSEYTEDNDNDYVSDPEYSDKTTEMPTNKRKYKYEYNFMCDMCPYSTTSKQRILDHLLRHVKYKCQICPERCFTRFQLEMHNKTSHGRDATEMAKEQLEKLKSIMTIVPNPTQIEEIITKYSDPSCDHCKNYTVSSLQDAKDHYKNKHKKDGYLKCCDIILRAKSDIKSHVLTHLYQDDFTCSVCGVIGKRREKFYRHLTVHLTDIDKYPHVCVLCNKGFTRDDLLDVHVRYYHENDPKVKSMVQHTTHTLSDFFTMQCDLCDTHFTSFQEAKQHYKAAHQITGYLICCDKKFIKAKTIDNHFMWHINPEQHKCEYCGKCFKQKVSYLRHIERHNTIKQKRFPCDQCGKRFVSKYYLKIHSKVHDKSVKKALQCSQCDKRYTCQKSLDDHTLYVHNNEEKGKEVCEFCGRRFVSRSSVANHVQTVHWAEAGLEDKNNPVVRSHCNMCKASFINKYRLKKHIDSVHLGKPVKCSQCDKVAPNDAALHCHMRSVHVAHSYQCHLCPKTFKAAVALKDHIATHTGAKMYKCSFCTEAFIWRPNMYSHQKKAHPEEWQELKSKQRKNPRKE